MRLALALAGVLLLLPMTARADEKMAARQLIDEGNALLEKKQYQAALARYRAAHELYPTPKIFYNMAEAHSELGALVEAAEYYERFLHEAGVPERSPLHRAATKAIAALEQRLGRLTVDGASFGAEVFLDGKAAGRVPITRMRVLPGKRQVVIQKEGFASKRTEVVVRAGEEATVDATLESTTPAAPPPPAVIADRPPPAPVIVETTPPPVAEEEGSIAGKWWFWTLIVGGVAVAAGATAIGITATRNEPYNLEGDLGVSSTDDWRPL